MADGDILGARIADGTEDGLPASTNGWVLELDVEGVSTGGTYALGIGAGNDPSTAKVVLTVSSAGFDATGAPTTVERQIHATVRLRKPYPDHATANEVEISGVMVTFTASPDHDATDPITGDPVVESYEIRVYDSDDELVGTENIGKPTPDGSDQITVTDSALLAGLSPGAYTLTVAALGPDSGVADDEIAVSYGAEFVI
jgi:hypothetical protein